ncbi:MAG: hypothetical protein GVY29_01345 [Spirochaetes bacterium]|jgi:uncharacterized membrane protein HdeD (DUF308 family)|nr:hypothetical protein [Spirochaetota bacterium]
MIVVATNRTLPMVSGIISLALGLVALVWPGITVQVLAVIIGTFLLAESLLSFLVRRRTAMFTWSAVLQGLVGIVVALLLIVLPGTAVRVVVMIMAVWLLLRGVIQGVLAVWSREIRGAPLFVGLIAAISLLVGALLILRPEAGVVAFAWLLGIYAIVSGAVSILWSRRAAQLAADDTRAREVGPTATSESEFESASKGDTESTDDPESAP